MTEKLLNYFKGDELAAGVWLGKYAIIGEETPDDMHKRLAREFARVDEKADNFLEREKILNLSAYGRVRENLTEEKIYNLFKDFKYIVPQGSIMSQLGADSIGSLSNCFVIGQPEDSYGGIFLKDQEMVQLMKRRGGVGIDISKLRPAETLVSNAAKTTTGAISFMHRYSNSTREVAQNGRRGALMLSIHINHPDVLEFIKIKRDLSQVTGANISIKINDEFMKAVEADEDYILRFPCNMEFTEGVLPIVENYNELVNLSPNSYLKKVKAKEYWEEIIKSAHGYAEPGIIFENNHHNYSPDGVYPEFKGVTTNPCFHPDTEVETEFGRMKIKDITKPMRVYSMDSDGRLVIANASASFISKYNAKTLKITLKNGNSIQVTPEHKMYVHNKGWVETKDIQLGDRIAHLCRSRKGSKTIVDLSTKLKTNMLSRFHNCVESIVEGETVDVYDIQVEDTHCLIANNMVAHNCGEIFMQPYDACRLIAVNLLSFVNKPFTSDASFDVKKFYEINYEAMRLSDDLIDLEVGHIKRIINKIEEDPESGELKLVELNLWNKVLTTAMSSRRTGLGFTALGDCMAALGIGYDSEEGLLFTEQFMHIKMESELDCTIDLAILRGTFIGWDRDKEYPLNVETLPELFGNDFYRMLHKEYPAQYHRMYEHGRRNVSWNTVAPTGTVSLLTQTTSGLEPIFQPFYIRRKKVNPGSDVRVDFTDQNGDTWQEFPVLHEQFRNWYLINQEAQEARIAIEEPDRDIYWTPIEELTKEQLQVSFEKSPWFNSTANDIDWKKRVEIQGIIQKYITHSISSTINLPNTVTEEEVAEIYMHSWKEGLKGVTVYRDGSRSGVLVTEPTKELVTFNENHAPKRPKSLPCKIVRFNNNYEKWIAFVGMMDNKPYEVFTGKADTVDLPLSIEVGEIKKVIAEDKRYDFIYDGGVVENISKVSSENYWNYGKLISSMLRHGMPLQFVVDTIQTLTWDHDNINTWKNGIARALKKFIKDGKIEGIKCNDCKSDNVIFEEGCSKCLDCGSSKCG